MRNRKSNRLIIIVLVLFILILSGYIVYDKVISNSKEVYSYNLEKRTTCQAVRHDYIEVLVDTSGDAYMYTIGNIENIDNKQIKKNINNLVKQFKTYMPIGYKYIDGSNELKAYKLDIDNVLTSYYVHKGNGGFSYFVFLKEDGKVSYLSYDKLIYNEEIDLKNIDNLKNVVSIVENTYSMTPYVITYDGNELSLYDYIK